MRGVRSVVAVVVLGASVVGCSPDPDPVPPSSSTSEPSASTPSPAPVEPSPTTEALIAPVLPQAATTPDAAGAEAFVGYWYELVNYAYASGDVGVVTSVSHVDCVACANLVTNVRSATDVGGIWRDLRFSPEQLETTTPDESGISVSTGLVIASPGGTVLMPDGSVVEVTGTEAEYVKFWSQWTGGRWQTFAIAFPERAQ